MEVHHLNFLANDLKAHTLHVRSVFSINEDDTPILKWVCGCECDPNILVGDSCVTVIHNSFDGREGVEWAKEILKKK